MAVNSNVAFVNTNGAAFPGNEGVNASGPTATDGTEFVKVMIDNYMFGPQQALLNFAGLTPNGIAEADGDSQELEALQKSFGFPGEAVNWYGNQDPGVVGARILLLHGQGVLVASYQELTDNVYVGDGNNATAPAFYKADDAAGTIRNIAGIYLILPDGRDVYPRFIPELTHGARIQNNGAATILSKSTDWLSSVSRTGLGVVKVTYDPTFFDDQPTFVAIVLGGEIIYGTSTGPASFDIRTANSLGNLQDRDFNVLVGRQDTDANPFGDNFIEPGIRF